MCLAIPGQVVEIQSRPAKPGDTPLMGKVDFSGIQKSVCLEWVPDVKVGEYVIVHVGFAISKVDEEEARETLKLFDQLTNALNELNPKSLDKNEFS